MTTRSHGLARRGSIPGWAIWVCNQLVRWCRDCSIRLRDPDRPEPESSWQVIVVVPGFSSDKKDFKKVLRIINRFYWVLSSDNGGLSLTIWPDKKRRSRR